MKQLLIFPYSGTGLEALDCLGDRWDCVGFVSDDLTIIGQKMYGITVYSRDVIKKYSKASILAVNGSPSSFRKREEIINSLQISRERFATVIHPSSNISTSAKIGINVLIMAGAVITFNANIGNHVVVLPNTVIHHDSQIGDYTLIAGNATIAGNVIVGKNCYIGASSSIKNEIHVADYTLVGMGANVISSNYQPDVLVGNPAKPLSS